MKRMALIGANGQLGRDLQKVFSSKRWQLFPLDHKVIEIKDPVSIDHALNRIKPEIVLNTAAFHEVDRAEDEVYQSFAVNALGIKNLSLWCFKHDVTLVHISTDYVFGGEENRRKPYKEDDLPAPLNTYGVSKLAGEYFISYLLKKYFIVRTSGLFGTAGSSKKGGNFVETMLKKARNKEQIRVVNDQILSPTYTRNLAQNLELLLSTTYYGLYHMSSQGECSWFEFAKAIFKLMGQKINIFPIRSRSMITPARRPTYSVLENFNLKKLDIDRMIHWSDNLRLYLIEKGYLIHEEKK